MPSAATIFDCFIMSGHLLSCRNSNVRAASRAICSFEPLLKSRALTYICHSACNIGSDAILVQLRLFCAD